MRARRRSADDWSVLDRFSSMSQDVYSFDANVSVKKMY